MNTRALNRPGIRVRPYWLDGMTSGRAGNPHHDETHCRIGGTTAPGADADPTGLSCVPPPLARREPRPRSADGRAAVTR